MAVIQILQGEKKPINEVTLSLYVLSFSKVVNGLLNQTQGSNNQSKDAQHFNLEIQVINNYHHHHHYYNFGREQQQVEQQQPNSTQNSLAKVIRPQRITLANKNMVDMTHQISPWSTTTLQLLEPDFNSAHVYNRKSSLAKHIHNHQETIVHPRDPKLLLLTASQSKRHQSQNNYYNNLSHNQSINGSTTKQTVFQQVNFTQGMQYSKYEFGNLPHNQSQNNQNTSFLIIDGENKLAQNNMYPEISELERSFLVQAIKVENQKDKVNQKPKKIRHNTTVPFFKERYKKEGSSQNKYIPESQKVVSNYQDQLRDFKDYVEKMCKSNFQSINLKKNNFVTQPAPLKKMQEEETKKNNDHLIKSLRLADQRMKLHNLLKQTAYAPITISNEVDMQKEKDKTGQEKLNKTLKCEGQQIRPDLQDFNNENSPQIKQEGMWFSKYYKRKSSVHGQRKDTILRGTNGQEIQGTVNHKEDQKSSAISNNFTIKRKSLNELYHDLDHINLGYTKVKGFLEKNKGMFQENKDYFQSLQNPQMPIVTQMNQRKAVATSYSTKRKISHKLQESVDLTSSAQGTHRQNLQSIYEENKNSQAEKNESLQMQNSFNLSSLLECQRLQTPNFKVNQKKRMRSQQDNNRNSLKLESNQEKIQSQKQEQKQDDKQYEEIKSSSNFNSSILENLKLISVASNVQPFIKVTNLKKQYVPKNMTMIARMIRNKQANFKSTSNSPQKRNSFYDYNFNIEQENNKKSYPQQKLVSIVYPLTDYPMGVEESNIHKELLGDKILLAQQNKQSSIIKDLQSDYSDKIIK